MTYDAYLAGIPTDPAFFHPNCTPARAQRAARALAIFAEFKFPGIRTGCGSGTTGPDSAACSEITAWLAAQAGKAFIVG